MPRGRLGQACEGSTVSSVFVAFQPEPPAGICRASHVPRNSQTTTSLLEGAHGCFDNPPMQELKVWESFLHLRHRQASYDMSVLPECLLDALKNLSLPVIFLRVTEEYPAFG